MAPICPVRGSQQDLKQRFSKRCLGKDRGVGRHGWCSVNVWCSSSSRRCCSSLWLTSQAEAQAEAQPVLLSLPGKLSEEVRLIHKSCLIYHSLCSPCKPSWSLLSAWTLILHWGSNLPRTAASDAHRSWRLSVICRAQFKPLLCGSIRLLIYRKARFCSPHNYFPKRSTSAAGVKSAKQSQVIDALVLVKEAWTRQREAWVSGTAQKKNYHKTAG